MLRSGISAHSPSLKHKVNTVFFVSNHSKSVEQDWSFSKQIYLCQAFGSTRLDFFIICFAVRQLTTIIDI